MTKSYKEIKKEKEGTNVQVEACWSGYKQVGMKKKGNKQVPNCVPESVVNALFGKDYIYEVSESVADMYKGTVTPAQLAKMKQLWKTKRASDVTPAVKNFVKGLDQFTQMDIKKANIKYISDLIEEFEEGEVELVDNFKDIVEENEMRVSVRRNENLKEFSTDQIERLAKAYSVMKDRTISVSNAQKLSKMMDGVPDSSLNAIRKKKIPFLSGLALSKMIKKKIPVTESTYEDKEDLQEARWEIEGRLSYRGISSEDSFYMVIDAPTESAAEDKAHKELDKARSKRKIGPGGGGSVEDVEIEGITRTTDKLSPPETFRGLNSFDPSLKEDFFVNDKKDTLKKFSGRIGYNKNTLSDYLAKKTGKNKDDVYFDDTELVYKDKTVLRNAETKTVDQMLKSLRKEEVNEADLTKSQIKKVHKQADDLPKKDFMKRYGKDGDSVRYATATNMVKKKLGLGESNFIKKGELKMNDTYKQRLTSAMEHFNISSLGELNEDDHKTFFSYVEDMKEGLSAAQKKLPPALQKAIAAKMKDKKEVKEDLVGGQKKLDKDKDGDLDAKDFAMLRKKEGSMKKEYGMNMKASYHNKMKKEEKTKETDSEPKMKDLNAMVKSSHKPDHKGNPIDDMNAGYMKSNVKAPVKDGGGADMAKVKDAPKMMNAMMKISNDKKMKNMKAMYGESRENAKRYLDTKPGSLEEAVLVSRGLIKKSITEARYEIEGTTGYRGIGSEDNFHMVINANSEKDAENKAYDELEKARNKRKIGPGGGGSLEDTEVLSVQKTNDKLSAPETFRGGN